MPAETKEIQVQLVTAPGCHFCDDAQRMLHTQKDRFPLTIELVPLLSETGRYLVARHRVPFPPILLIEGEFFGYGRLSQRRLEQRLIQLMTAKAG
jgi:hypothetical protein